MVLVSDKLSNAIGILQTELSDREGHEARRIGLEAMPLDQHIEGRHGEREPGVEIRPHAVHDLFEMAHQGQHREHCLHQHAVLPFTALTQFEVGGIAFRRMEAGVTQDNHLFFKLSNQPLKGGVIRDMGRGTLPRHDQSPLIEQQTEFPADNPAVVREAFAAELLRAAAFAHGVNQLDAEGRSPQQIGRKGLSNHRWIVGGKLCLLLNQWGLVVAWACDTANVADNTFQWLIREFEERMIVLSDTGFHAAEGDPSNLKLCQRGEWQDRLLVETVLSMLTVVCHFKKVMHRGWEFFHARLAFTMAAFNVLVQWHGLLPNASGFVPLSMAEFSL